MEKINSQSYQAKKTSIEKNNKRYKQLKFMLLPDEKQAFENLAKNMKISNIELFKLAVKNIQNN